MGDFAGGLASRSASVVVTLAAGQIVGLAATAVLVALANEPVPEIGALAWAGVAGISGVTGLGAFYLALSRGTMGLVAPLAALVGAAVPAVVGLLGGEAASSGLLVGIGAALAAVVLISLPDRRAPAAGTPGQPARTRNLALALGAGLGFAGFYLGMDQSRIAGGETWWPILAVRLAGIAVVTVAVLGLVARGRLLWPRLSPRLTVLFLLAGLGDLGGNLFFIVANASGDLPVAVVISSLYPVVTAVLARVILGERMARLRIVGVGLATVSVVLIALARA